MKQKSVLAGLGVVKHGFPGNRPILFRFQKAAYVGRTEKLPDVIRQVRNDPLEQIRVTDTISLGNVLQHD